MRNKQPDEAQFELNFDGQTGGEVCAYPPDATDDNAPVASADRGQAVVFSISERVARKQQANDDLLYEGILARIKHLQL